MDQNSFELYNPATDKVEPRISDDIIATIPGTNGVEVLLVKAEPEGNLALHLSPVRWASDGQGYVAAVQLDSEGLTELASTILSTKIVNGLDGLLQAFNEGLAKIEEEGE